MATITYKLWENFLSKSPRQYVVEGYLYTDAKIYGQFDELGPYSLINTIAHAGYFEPAEARPAILLRVFVHGDTTAASVPMKDDFDHYHGGDFLDEVAALVSLFLGCRMMAGSVDREFRSNENPFGRPMQWGSKIQPKLPLAMRQKRIRRLGKGANLTELSDLVKFPDLTANQTDALMKAARMYQQAVWSCDASPEYSWLTLVSAVETIAVVWSQEREPADQKLKAAIPELYDLLESSACPGLLAPIAEMLSRYTGATKKFLDFLVHFMPAAPTDRPGEAFCFPFEASTLRKSANIIYGHRSAALHSGVAFPLPMCEPPFVEGPDIPPSEVPIGLAMSARGATWENKQTPMMLHTFEHIARGAILNWWRSL